MDGVLNAMFDVSLELFAAGLLGPRCKSRAMTQVWMALLPELTNLLMRDPRTVAAAMSNAAYQIDQTIAARTGEWIETMRRIGPKCQSVSELLDAGKVAAWRAGLPQYRQSAIAVARTPSAGAGCRDVRHPASDGGIDSEPNARRSMVRTESR